MIKFLLGGKAQLNATIGLKQTSQKRKTRLDSRKRKCLKHISSHQEKNYFAPIADRVCHVVKTLPGNQKADNYYVLVKNIRENLEIPLVHYFHKYL